MMNKLTDNELKFIVLRVVENAKDIFSEKDSSDFTNGKRLAYYEILDTIKSELEVRDIDLSEYGLDINLEKLL